MAKNKFSIFNALAKGKGLGIGSSYTPWLSIRDLASKGFSDEPFGIKSRRVHHFLSTPESECFILSEFNQKVTDIREQFPLLNVKLVSNIISQLKIKPSNETYNGKSYPRIFTTDLLLTFQENNRIWYEAISVKKDYASLSKKRALELQEVERIYWNSLGIKWSLFIQDECSSIVASNIDLITTPIRASGIELNLSVEDINLLSVLPIGEIELSELFNFCASELGVSAQQCKVSFARLFWMKLINIDLTSDITASKMINILGFNESVEGKVNGHIA